MANFNGATPRMLQLVLEHNCQHQGCSDAACPHCKYSSTRRCSAPLRSSYVSGGLLLAGCGASPEVLLDPAQTGAQAAGQWPAWQLQVQLLDNVRYETQASRQASPLSWQQLESCLESSKALLKYGTGPLVSCLTLPAQASRVSLSGLRCVKPEHSVNGQKQSGKTTRFRLLFTVAALGPWQGFAAVAPLVTDPFTVVTTRSKSAAKSEVPLPGEPVNRLHGVGKDFAASLEALKDVAGHQRAVKTVGQFYSLQQWVVQGGKERRQQLLAATGIKRADFEKAAEHVQHTAFADFRPRIWWQPQQGRGLLCCWNQAATAPGAVLAWAVQQGSGYVLAPLAMPGHAPDVQEVAQLALRGWGSPGHGSWQVCWSDADDWLAESWAREGLPINLQAPPVGITNAIAASAGAAGVGAPAAAAADPAPAAGVGVLAVWPPTPQQLRRAVPVAAAASFNRQFVLQQQQQQQEVPGAPTLLLQPMVQQPPPTQVLSWQLLAPLLLQQQLQQVRQQQLALEPRYVQRPLQLQLPPLGPECLLPLPAEPDTPSGLLELPMAASAAAATDPLVQGELQAQTSDASSFMDQDLQLQQPHKRQRLMQQQEAVEAQDAAVDGMEGVVTSAVADTVSGPAEGEAVEQLGGEGVVPAERQSSFLLSVVDTLTGPAEETADEQMGSLGLGSPDLQLSLGLVQTPLEETFGVDLASLAAIDDYFR